MTTNGVLVLLPELLILLTIVGLLLAEVGYYQERMRLVTLTALLGVGSAFLQSLLSLLFGPVRAFDGMLTVDGLSIYFKILAYMFALFSIVGISLSNRIRLDRRVEAYVFVLSSVLGVSITVSSGHLLLTFFGLQLLCLSTLFLIAIDGRNRISVEAAVKYFAPWVISSACFLFGAGILFSVAHTFNLQEIHAALVAHELTRTSGLVVFLLFFISIGFQMGAFPAIHWVPDVLTGGVPVLSSLLVTLSRLAGFSVFIRLVSLFFSQSTDQPGTWRVLGQIDWTVILSVCSGVTLLYGGLLALRQKTILRRIGYLFVSQTGFLMMGVVVLNDIGMGSMLFHLLIDGMAALGTIASLGGFFEGLPSDRFEDVQGTFSVAAWESFCVVFFLASFVGIPPFPGFIAKFAMFESILVQKWYLLALVGLVGMILNMVSVVELLMVLMGSGKGNQMVWAGADGSTQGIVLKKAFLVLLFLPLAGTLFFCENILNLSIQVVRYILW